MTGLNFNDEPNALARQKKSVNMSGVMDKFGAVAGGAMGILNTYQDLADIADTSGYWEEIEDAQNLGKSNYYDIDALSQDYARMADLNQMYNYRDVRGKSDGEMAMGIGSSMLEGAAAGASFGPYGCVCAGTRVITNDGKFVNIEDLKKEDGIIGWDGNRASKESIFAFKKPAEKECVKITFSNGDTLSCSDDHPILFHAAGRQNRQTINGKRCRVPSYEFTEAKNLKEDDVVAGISEIPIFGSVDAKDARLLGLVIGDGACSKKHGVRFYSMDKELWDYIEDNSLGLRIRYDDSRYSSEFRGYRIYDGNSIMEHHGINNRSRNHKILPIDIHTFSKKSLAEFIAGLYDTDGCVYANDLNDSRIEFSQTNKNLINLLKEQLLKFGIQSYIIKEKAKVSDNNGRKYITKTNYKLIIRDAISLILFSENIPLLIERKKNNLKKILKYKKSISKRKNRYFGAYPIKVRKVEKIGKQFIYNLQADDDHTYIANGIITHNTAAGAAIGLGAGLAGMFSGNRKARREQRYLTDRAQMAADSANRNLNAAHEQLLDYQFRSGVSNRAASGGKITRKSQSLQEFADRIYNRQKTNDASRSAGVIRTHCNGGTMIRIKR